FFGFTMPINRAKEYHRITIRVETISLKLTKEQAKLLAAASKEQGFPSKSEFVRYAIARPGGPLEREDHRGYLRVAPTNSGGKDRPARAIDERGMSGWRSGLSSRNSLRKSSGSGTNPYERGWPESSGRLRWIPLDT